MRWRWQRDESPGTPWANMAQDRALLEELIGDPEALPIVRVYHWDRPSVSIGRLQDEHAVTAEFPHLPAVRRPTGGLAVVHGEDVTVSVVVRESHLPMTQSRGVMSSYRQIVGAVIDAFRTAGLPATLGGADRSPGHKGSIHKGSVDCFAVAARCDVIAQESGRKLAGCAQRREQGVVLQQMSIPYDNLRSEQAFLEALQDSFTRIMGVSEWFSVDTLTPV